MQIIYITDQYPVGEHNRNGIYIYRTAIELSAHYDIIILALHPIIPPILPMLKNLRCSIKIYKEWRTKFPIHPKPPKGFEDVKVVYSKFFRLPRPKFLYTEAWGAYFTAKFKIQKILNQETILHANWIFPEGQLARILSKKFNIPYLVTLRGSEFIYLNNNNLNGKFAQRVFNDAKKITAVANVLRSQGEEKGIKIKNQKFTVLNDFYDFGIFEIRDRATEKDLLNLSDGEKNILFPGALRKLKNIYSILKSIMVLQNEKFYKMHLYLAGYGYEENKLRIFIDENNLSKSVTFLGNVSPELLVSYYNASDLICLASYSEGFPTVIVESLLCGTPVVASNVGGIPEVIHNDENGFLVDPKSVESLTDGLVKCIEKKWDRGALRESVSYLRKDKLLIAYDKLYSEVLN